MGGRNGSDVIARNALIIFVIGSQILRIFFSVAFSDIIKKSPFVHH